MSKGKLKRNLDTKENRDWWEAVEKAAAEVDKWPEWMKKQPLTPRDGRAAGRLTDENGWIYRALTEYEKDQLRNEREIKEAIESDMSEYTYRAQVIKTLKRMRTDPQAVENSANPGCPDVECLRGWIELKYLPKWPKQPDTVVRIDHFTQQQRNFLRRRWNAGGGAWLLLRVGQRGQVENLLFDGLDAWEFVGRVPRARLVDLAIMHSYGRVSAADLDENLRRWND